MISKFLQLLPSPIKEDLRLGLFNRVFKTISEGYSPRSYERLLIKEMVAQQIAEKNPDILPYVQNHLTAISGMNLMVWYQLDKSNLQEAAQYALDLYLPQMLDIIESQSIRSGFDLSFPFNSEDNAKNKAVDLAPYIYWQESILDMVKRPNLARYYEHANLMTKKFDKIYGVDYYRVSTFRSLLKIYNFYQDLSKDVRSKLDSKESITPTVIKSPQEFENILKSIQKNCAQLSLQNSIGIEHMTLLEHKINVALPEMLTHYCLFSESERRNNQNSEGKTPYDLVHSELLTLKEETDDLLTITLEDKFKNLTISTKTMRAGR